MITSRFRWNESTLLELTSPKRAYIYFRNSRLNLLTGFPETYSLTEYLKELSQLQLKEKVKGHRVYHFYYEFGLILQGLGHGVTDEMPLVIDIEYERSKKTSLKKTKIDSLPLKCIERPSWSEYKKAFQHIQDELNAGNCYQVNLTYPFDFETAEFTDPRDIVDFFFTRKGLGAFAHSTQIHDELILSNSPECLFQLQGENLFTMPIKGTMKRKGSFQKDWRELKESVKDEAELLMITDLLRNDLNRIDKPRAKIIRKRAPLLVPGLIHQYSLLSTKVKNNVSLLHTLECLFPGGSVTGAPKKRVMKIIQETERFNRGVYCGSTLLCYGSRKVASINIRTAQIDLGERLWRLGAGGGVTLESSAVWEFQEMEAKIASFLTLLGVPGYAKKPE